MELSGVNFDSYFETPSLSSAKAGNKDKSAFSTILDSAANLITETNAYSNAAEEEEIKLALGETDSIHDLQIAQQKANVSLQYTVAVRDAFMSAYKEIMNLQI
ncbi:MAG: flagellar hook-basal body complex protein FliE [Lachnospiraceae bacterium]|jgi:flagellar hook-basal body complex protein FliE|nr:flagellar hook-basal body complex protein FliE [Lachnospiraceae bacterium]